MLQRSVEPAVFFGRLSERYPRNVSFLVGIGAFTAASAACAAATDTEMLVVFRVVQAAAAALMTPTSLGLLLFAFPPEGRSGAVRTWTAAGGVAAATVGDTREVRSNPMFR